MSRKIRIAVPSKGRLRDPCIRALENIGLNLRGESRSYIAEVSDPRFEVIYTRTFDVPLCVHYGAVDLGMAGYDLILERQVEVYELLDLGFGKCRLVVAVPEESEIRSIESISVMPRVATEYPNLSRKHFGSLGKQAEILAIRGTAELAPRLGLAEMIVDITETGETLRRNGLRVIDTILESSCRLICNKIAYRVFENEINELVVKLKNKRS